MQTSECTFRTFELADARVLSSKKQVIEHVSALVSYVITLHANFLSLISVRAAMSSATVLESEATFQMQAQCAGLSQSYIDCVKTAALGTLTKLAYALTTPGTAYRNTSEQVSERCEASGSPHSG